MEKEYDVCKIMEQFVSQLRDSEKLKKDNENLNKLMGEFTKRLKVVEDENNILKEELKKKTRVLSNIQKMVMNEEDDFPILKGFNDENQLKEECNKNSEEIPPVNQYEFNKSDDWELDDKWETTSPRDYGSSYYSGWKHQKKSNKKKKNRKRY